MYQLRIKTLPCFTCFTHVKFNDTRTRHIKPVTKDFLHRKSFETFLNDNDVVDVVVVVVDVFLLLML